MELKIRNVNKIQSADIQLNGLTVIVGENDSGKSTIGRVLFSAIKALVNTKANKVQKREELLEKHVQSLYRRLFSIGLLNFSVASRNTSPIPRNAYGFISELKKKDTVDEYIKETGNYIENIETTPRMKSLMKEDLDLIGICMKEKDNRAATLYAEFRFLLESEFLNQFASNNNNVYIDLLSDDKSKSYFRYSRDEDIVESHCEDEDALEDITYIESPLYLHMLDSLMNAGAYREIDKRHRSLRPLIPYHIKDFVEKMNAARSFLPTVGQLSFWDEKPINTQDIIGGCFSYDNNRKSIIFTKNGLEILPLNTASGVKSFGVIQMLLDGEYIDANSPLIWDEPENHLHPEWQVEFAKILVEIYKSGVPIIVTTHSPYFLQAIRFFAAKEKAEDFVSYYMSQPTEDGFVTMENVTNDLNKVFKKLATPLTSIMNIDAARQGIDL